MGSTSTQSLATWHSQTNFHRFSCSIMVLPSGLNLLLRGGAWATTRIGASHIAYRISANAVHWSNRGFETVTVAFQGEIEHGDSRVRASANALWYEYVE